MSPRRQPDGRPEWRSVDEMLAQAIAGEDFATLPGKGQPLDLSAYFASGPEHRIAGKLLKDNAILPQTLQDRRDAEQLCIQASQTLATQKEYLSTLKTKFVPKPRPCAASFPTAQPHWPLSAYRLGPNILRTRECALARPPRLARRCQTLSRTRHRLQPPHRSRHRRILRLPAPSQHLRRAPQPTSAFSRHLPAACSLRPPTSPRPKPKCARHFLP